MKALASHEEQIRNEGFSIIGSVYTDAETAKMHQLIEHADDGQPAFKKSKDLFAVRQLLKEVPALCDVIFSDKLRGIINELFGKRYFVVKSIYFDKPAASNWFVAYHQDLTISVDQKLALENYGPWTVKQNQFAVQPPTAILENIFTVRIHLDDTDIQNGALKVIPGSHLKSIYRPETIDWNKERETVCEVPAGGIMIMKPLLLHSSSRTTNEARRRVIHIEFADAELPEGIDWSEKLVF